MPTYKRKGSSVDAKRLWGLSLSQKGKTSYESYEKAGDFNSAGTKRAGSTKYESYPADMQNKADGDYAGGVSQMPEEKSRRGGQPYSGFDRK
jgi:hypothetical protein